MKMKMMLIIAFVLMLSISTAKCSRRDGERILASSCKPSGFLKGNSHECNRLHNSECCKSGEKYPQYKCSPRVTEKTKATLSLNGFDRNEDGGGPSECDGKYHKNSELVVALSTGWYAGGSRCHKQIQINNPGNGRSVKAMVVDECDSFSGCDNVHDFQPPCANNIVDASPAVWKALGVDDKDAGLMSITWSDA
ncbi:hypothetical protein SUGI_0021860 [Cryptomeria japonica]|uniref:putative ripening-related protein 1 n=1 Tax=Cryptomeria japonica TaxID=3369 RepID=UPI0024089A5F|nr:putative ripening-related protein 1 [Cryptomeria japonica]GLJ05633.1 hypothetical protein SUGI_0021860 [Cryptomeria japonica]